MDDQEPLGREYILHDEIGRGAHAVVRRATSRLGGPPLAAKLLKPEYAEDRRVRELFIREEAALRDLEHPSIVGIRDVVVERGRIALLMDHVDGSDLRRYLSERGGRLPAPDAAWIAAQSAAALAVAHAHGVVHLDLKPENILVVRGTDPTRIRISDFGVAALLHHDTAHTPVGGTPGYLAPEVAAGGAATTAADVYSLGVVLREMLGGDVPQPLQALVGSCLAADPRTRPSARVVAIRLRDARSALLAAADTAGISGAAGAAGPDDAGAMGAEGAGAMGAVGAGAAAREERPDTRLRPGVVARTPAPAPPPEPEPARWRRGPLLTLAAGALIAAVLAGLSVNAAAGQRTDNLAGITVPPSSAAPTTTAPGGSAAPPAVPPATDPVVTSAPAERLRATFAGRVRGGGGTLAISVRDGVAIAYICDGKRIESWLKGTARAGKLALTGKNGARITATFDERRARGDVTVAGRTFDFDIRVAKKPSGLYRAAARVRNAEVVGSWIVLPDGSQVGVLDRDGVPGPAPSLDVAGRTTTVDGTAVRASTIDVDSGEGF